jgi:flagellar FliJ protein
MAGFRLKSLLRVRQIQEDQAAGRLADAQRHATAEQRRAAHERALLDELGGANVLAAAGIARATAARQLAEIQSAQAVAAGEVQAAEQALLLAVQARRSAELLKERHEQKLRALADKAEQQVLDELASTAHHRAGDSR